LAEDVVHDRLTREMVDEEDAEDEDDAARDDEDDEDHEHDTPGSDSTINTDYDEAGDFGEGDLYEDNGDAHMFSAHSETSKDQEEGGEDGFDVDRTDHEQDCN